MSTVDFVIIGVVSVICLMALRGWLQRLLFGIVVAAAGLVGLALLCNSLRGVPAAEHILAQSVILRSVCDLLYGVRFWLS